VEALSETKPIEMNARIRPFSLNPHKYPIERNPQIYRKTHPMNELKPKNIQKDRILTYDTDIIFGTAEPDQGST
jgi:hypothetical protein